MSAFFGLGDQGIGGMGIPIGKLALYTACGGISPAYMLPIVLDVGTNNLNCLADPMYMGWRHLVSQKRLHYVPLKSSSKPFNVALAWCASSVRRFRTEERNYLLERYKDRICCFNDDIQGTAAVTVGSLLAACKAANSKLSDQRITFLGAGLQVVVSQKLIIAQMVSEGISDEQARSQVYMVDRWGLLQEGMQNPFTSNSA